PNAYVGLYTDQWSFVGSSSTNSTGHYVFNNVAPGNYRIMFGMPMNGAFSPEHQGSDPALDSDANGYGQTDVFTLAPQQIRTGIDAGIVPYPAIGDFVWNDANGNGIQDAGEAGVAGVSVALLTSSGSSAGSATTDSTGHYRFNSVYPGT